MGKWIQWCQEVPLCPMIRLRRCKGSYKESGLFLPLLPLGRSSKLEELRLPSHLLVTLQREQESRVAHTLRQDSWVKGRLLTLAASRFYLTFTLCRTHPVQYRTNPFSRGCWISHTGSWGREISDSWDIWSIQHHEGNGCSSVRESKSGAGWIKVIKIDFPTPQDESFCHGDSPGSVSTWFSTQSHKFG